MTIIAPTALAPLAPRAAVDASVDVAAEAWSLYGELMDLARLGLRARVEMAAGAGIEVTITVPAAATDLLLGLVAELEDVRLAYRQQTIVLTGTSCLTTTHLVVGRGDLTAAELADLVTVAELAPEEPGDSGQADEALRRVRSAA